MVIPSQKTNRDTTNMCPTINFHIYRNLSHFKIRDRCTYEEHTTCSMCSTIPYIDKISKVYIWQELVLVEKLNTSLYQKFYILVIQKLEFHFPHVPILGTHHCGKELCDAFKHRGQLYNIGIYLEYVYIVFFGFGVINICV